MKTIKIYLAAQMIYSSERLNIEPREDPLGLMTAVIIWILALGKVCSSNKPSRRYSFSSMVTMSTESLGLSSLLASLSRRSIMASHLECW